jgi:hypothetical protein
MDNNEQANRINQAINYANHHYDNTRDNIVNMLNAILELGLVEWVRTFNYRGGFGANGGENYLIICNHRYVRIARHYGTSHAECLRACQMILLND